ncbi:MAG: DUF2231 domain-containing protein [Gemmatimonadales bacterium]
MAVRLREVHPAVVHAPIALLPLAVAADVLGRVTGRRSLREAGRHLMPVAAVGAAAAALTGLVAQHEVQADGRARDMLVTHRKVNLTVVGLTTLLATWRWRQRAPSSGYLALGLAGVGLLGYSAYLGTKMVYAHGVGVDAAGGIRPAGRTGPERGNAAAVRTAAGDMLRGLTHAASARMHRVALHREPIRVLKPNTAPNTAPTSATGRAGD